MQFSDWQLVKRLLVVYVGDTEAVMQLKPALRTLRAALPDTAITFLTSLAEGAVTPLLPWVNDVLHYANWWQDASREQKLIEMIGDRVSKAGHSSALPPSAERKFDAAIIFTDEAQSPLALAYLCYLAGIPIRIGQSKEFGGGVLSHWIKPATDDTVELNRHLYLLESAGLSVSQLSEVMHKF